MRIPLSVVVLVSSLALGCKSGPGPSKADLANLPEPAALLASLRQQSAGRSNLRAMGRVTAFGPDGRVRLRTVLVAERPGSFRFETLTPFEQPIDVMTSDGHRLWLLREGRLFEGPATAQNVSRLLPLPLRPEEVVETLLGGVPVSSRFRPIDVTIDDGRWLLHLDGFEQGKGRLWVDPDTLRVLDAEHLTHEGAVLTAVHFAGFQKAQDGGPAVPTEIEIKVPPQSMEVRIRFRETETDVQLPPGLFVMAPPSGQTAEPLPGGPLGGSEP